MPVSLQVLCHRGSLILVSYPPELSLRTPTLVGMLASGDPSIQRCIWNWVTSHWHEVIRWHLLEIWSCVQTSIGMVLVLSIRVLLSCTWHVCTIGPTYAFQFSFWCCFSVAYLFSRVHPVAHWVVACSVVFVITVNGHDTSITFPSKLAPWS